MRAHAVKNEFLPLRTVVQLLYFEQEKDSKETTSSKLQKSHDLLLGAKKRTATRDSHGKRSLVNKEEVTRRISHAESREKGQHKTKRSDGKLALNLEKKMVIMQCRILLSNENDSSTFFYFNLCSLANLMVNLYSPADWKVKLCKYHYTIWFPAI